MFNFYSYEKKLKAEKDEMNKRKKEELIESKRKSNLFLLKKSLYLLCAILIRKE